MRNKGARTAAALLVLALGAAGCDLVSSLTPFGVETRDYASETSGQNVNGIWAGETASGGPVTFQVGDDVVSLLILTHLASGCTLEFDASDIEAPVVDGVFTVELDLEAGGRVVIAGRFTSSSASSGSYFFEGLPAGICPTSGTGTFDASKLF